MLRQNLGHKISESPDWPLILRCQSSSFVDCSLYTFNILVCSACCRPSRTWITFNRFLTIFEAFVPHIYLHCTHCIIPESLLNHLNSSMFRWMECSSLPQKSMQNHCSTQAFWMQWPHSTHAHSMVSATSTDEYSKVVIVHTCAFQSTLLHCQVTLILHKLFLLY